jgi:hypothetical protein
MLMFESAQNKDGTKWSESREDGNREMAGKRIGSIESEWKLLKDAFQTLLTLSGRSADTQMFIMLQRTLSLVDRIESIERIQKSNICKFDQIST